MKFTLKDYQADAVADVLANLIDAREDYHRPRPRLSAFSLSAVTGAGKTVMAAAVIEALFAGNDDFSFAPDPGAVVLWFTSDPSLNEQTRHRILQATEEIPYSRLVAIGNTFAGDRLEPGHVYFLNSQKLSARSLLVRGGTLADAENMLIAPDRRANTFWDVLRNTIEDPALTLYVILDEAHRGMKRPNRNERAEKSTIVRQLVNGEAGAPPVPVVLGISATVERFNQAMADSSGRTLLPNVVVDPARVQESGLLKDDIRLDFPAETGTFDTVLLRRGVRRVKESTQHWADYHRAQETTEDPVTPLLVVQVPNTPSDQMLLDALQAIADEWPELGDANIAHVFGEHTDLVIGGRVISYISPEHVQQRTAIRVLLAKDAISTGWDCPRAEVLVSYRPAHDDTHITQLLGRMVRTPLARRIPGDDRLNSVECILPFFERSTARKVVELLLGVASSDSDDDDLDAGGGSGGGDGRRVLLGPIDMQVNATIPVEVWNAFDQLPSETLPRKGARPTSRLSGLAQAFAYDRLVPNATKLAHTELLAVLDGLAARYADVVDEARQDVRTVDGETIIASIANRTFIVDSTFTELADDRTVDAEYRAAGRVLGKDIAARYAERIADRDGNDDAFFAAHLQVAALAKVPTVADELNRAATGTRGTMAGRVPDPHQGPLRRETGRLRRARRYDGHAAADFRSPAQGAYGVDYHRRRQSRGHTYPPPHVRRARRVPDWFARQLGDRRARSRAASQHRLVPKPGKGCRRRARDRVRGRQGCVAPVVPRLHFLCRRRWEHSAVYRRSARVPSRRRVAEASRSGTVRRGPWRRVPPHRSGREGRRHAAGA